MIENVQFCRLICFVFFPVQQAISTCAAALCFGHCGEMQMKNLSRCSWIVLGVSEVPRECFAMSCSCLHPLLFLQENVFFFFLTAVTLTLMQPWRLWRRKIWIWIWMRRAVICPFGFRLIVIAYGRVLWLSRLGFRRQCPFCGVDRWAHRC